MKFLFLEDNFDDIVLACRVLAQHGFLFTHVCMADEYQFLQEMVDSDVLFVDCRLPQFSCNEALLIWSDRGRKQPFIILSGTITREEKYVYLSLGVTDVVLKDNLGELGSVTQKVLNEFAMKVQIESLKKRIKFLEAEIESLKV